MQANMYDVVTRGTGTNAQIPGYAVGGKTGTAEIGDTGLIDTWFTAFAGQPGQPATVAVAVVVLNQPDKGGETTGGVVAAPIAKQVLQKILAVQQVPAAFGNVQPQGIPG
jgi:peptidoglycan glycosyltransferase